jgi:hypothetical protein
VGENIMLVIQVAFTMYAHVIATSSVAEKRRQFFNFNVPAP